MINSENSFMNSNVFFFFIKRLIILCIAGMVIGFFHEYDKILAILLAINCGLVFYRKRKLPSKKLFFFGFIATGICGVIAEYWGVANGFWEYHDLSGNRAFPYWLPFAWALAFSFIYSFESGIVQQLQLTTLQQKIWLTIFASAVLPTVGEMVTIYLGVWTYYWPFKIIGVPLYAIGLLVVFHTGISFVMYKLNQKWQTNDPVFSVKS